MPSCLQFVAFLLLSYFFLLTKYFPFCSQRIYHRWEIDPWWILGIRPVWELDQNRSRIWVDCWDFRLCLLPFHKSHHDWKHHCFGGRSQISLLHTLYNLSETTLGLWRHRSSLSCSKSHCNLTVSEPSVQSSVFGVVFWTVTEWRPQFALIVPSLWSVFPLHTTRLTQRPHNWTNSILQHLKENCGKLQMHFSDISSMTIPLVFNPRCLVLTLQFTTGPSKLFELPEIVRFFCGKEHGNEVP